ncbi:hypothetical protein [Mycolicibacterium fluoranthenivorans]|uniref:Uncharacterized protein n=1 Tax=Mycolicibacterium fluoranthenivorans TaxID=258505 RepID=A0A7X5U5S9_9MYCO|nr:hypothetical protein [Mycolicibacterium fluoranthenivorans]MCV7359158.1 hypothetical protein [Mycolicibacterium fluoranthenivorans]NIH98956.1 hypothetical protein [Mycolicibacterium fluoranthenivorans]
MSRTRNLAVSVVIGGAIVVSSDIASAAPFCFKTGPGYQKCVVSGHDLTPIYQGPEVFTGGNVPWVPTYTQPAAPAIPPDAAPNPIDTLATWVMSSIQNTFDANPENAQANVRVQRVSLTQTGPTTFEGIATMTAFGNPPHDIPVHVFNDNGTPSWKIDPGVMMVLLQ